MSASLFRSASVPLGSSSLRVFVGQGDVYALTADLAASLSLQTSSLRGHISKNRLGNLIAVADLKQWLIAEGIVSSGTGKLAFAPSDVWLRVIESRVSAAIWNAATSTVRDWIAEVNPNDAGHIIHRVNDDDDDDGHNEDDDVHLFGEESLDPDAAVPMDLKDDVPADASANVEEHCEFDANRESCSSCSGSDHDSDHNSGSGSDEDNNGSGNHSDQDNIGYESGNGDQDNADSDEDSSSSDSSEADHFQTKLPQGVPNWVLVIPTVPDQFSSKQFTKSYALKPYDIPASLRKELKKMRKWWTRERNVERKSKAVQATTLDKREERQLCYLGFVHRYKCLPPHYDLTIALYLNHELVQAYLEYLKIVRGSSDGTICESLTGAIAACKWMYRKSPTAENQITIIRRYKDLRNEYQTKAARARKTQDVEELQLAGKWVDWSEFLALIAKLRGQWKPSQIPTVKEAHQLHDLLLLGLYSCTPARGCEIRLLEFIPGDTLQASLAGKLTLKKYAESEKINLITQLPGEWTMVVSQYKVLFLAVLPVPSGTHNYLRTTDTLASTRLRWSHSSGGRTCLSTIWRTIESSSSCTRTIASPL